MGSSPGFLEPGAKAHDQKTNFSPRINAGAPTNNYAFRENGVVEIESGWTAKYRVLKNVGWAGPDLPLPRLAPKRWTRTWGTGPRFCEALTCSSRSVILSGESEANGVEGSAVSSQGVLPLSAGISGQGGKAGLSGPRGHHHASDALQDLIDMGDAPVCSVCGAIMTRNGSCYRCMSCGSTSGCS
ncbi:MAG: hypothetical protein WBQ76_15210 [Candidatus Korobacteraceae bacterium]